MNDSEGLSAVQSLIALLSPLSYAMEEITLFENGIALMPIVVSPTASSSVTSSANKLVDYLGQITGDTFQIVQGNGEKGIAVGTATDFPHLCFTKLFNLDQTAEREGFILQTHSAGLYIIGATDLAVQHAVWEFLYKLGYRQFFPTETWEVVPKKDTIKVALDDYEVPSFSIRRGPHQAPWSDVGYWNRWQERNRMTAAFALNTGHSYDRIYSENRSEFEAHPEYLALVNGERRKGSNIKFCISNPALRELVVQWALRTFRNNPLLDSISLDPSDGGNWCECEACAVLGIVSDRVVLLANEVAEAINEEFTDKYVGIYAYNEHSSPPNIEVHPNVIASIATNFIRGGFTFDELIDGWSGQKATIGIRDYHDVHTWNWAKPRLARGGDVNYLSEKIPYFYEEGARFYISESSDSWGANGLGYYLSARLLWDVEANVTDLIEDFIDKAFEEAREPMREFYHIIAEDTKSFRTNEDLVGRMYRLLDQAQGLTADPKVRARLEELVLYTRYVELIFPYENLNRNNQAASEALFCHTYRMRDTMLVHSQALYRGMRRFNGSNATIPEQANPGNLVIGAASEDYGRWKSSKPFTSEEIATIISEGIKNNQILVLEFEPVSFSEDLVPAAEKLNLPIVATGAFNSGWRGQNTLYTWFPSENDELQLTVRGGTITHYQDRGNVRFKLYSPLETFGDPVAEDESVPPDNTDYQITLQSPFGGLHRLEWNDGNDKTIIKWPESWPMTMKSEIDDPGRPQSRWTAYFYVPKGTKIVGGYTTATTGTLRNSAGTIELDFTKMEGSGYFSVAVPEGQDGKLWKFDNVSGSRMLMTVPSYLARNARELLLPKEVVERDISLK